MVFLVLILLCFIGYLLHRNNKLAVAARTTGNLADCALYAGASLNDTSKYIKEFSHWVGDVPMGSCDQAVFSLYDLYGIPRPDLPVINSELQSALSHTIHEKTRDRRVYTNLKAAKSKADS